MNIMENESLQSETMRFLRFPLILGVTLIHLRFFYPLDVAQDGNSPICVFLFYLFTIFFSRIAVPLFFFISGFLFFYRVDSFTGHTYLQKLKKRVSTLLVPYLFWNLALVVFYFLLQSFIPELYSGGSKLVRDYTIFDWLGVFWNINIVDHKSGSPIVYQFWFIRDLMGVMLLSPFIYWVIKKLYWYLLVFLGILWILNCWFDMSGFSLTAYFFFSFGAYFSVHKKNFVEVMRPLLLLAGVLYALDAIVAFSFREYVWCDYLYRIGYPFGIVLAISSVAYLIDKRGYRANLFLSDSSFFIYAYHGISLAFIVKIVSRFSTCVDSIVLALCAFCLVIFIGLFLYYLLRKYFPIFTNIITGGR